MPRRRADLLLVERGFFATRAKAQAAIAAGLVTVDGTPVARASDQVRAEGEIAAEAPHPWVSRAGVKLSAALDAFAIDPRGRLCLDLGASTGASPRCSSPAAPRGCTRLMSATASSIRSLPWIRGS
jgi:23S rRNA (cytidine1920-2'-O)/16S rRNA (cytidine1409-2'-O)-methyltransferase